MDQIPIVSELHPSSLVAPGVAWVLDEGCPATREEPPRQGQRVTVQSLSAEMWPARDAGPEDDPTP